MKIINFFLIKFNQLTGSNNDLTSVVKKNVFGNFFLKGLSVLINLLYIPVTLNYLNPTRYGIWITLTSIIAWISILDIGIGNGLKNKLAEALSLGQLKKARIYVSTAYISLFFIVFSFIVLFLIANLWIDWSVILNTNASYRQELSNLIIIVLILFGFKYVLNLISTILLADQRSTLGGIFEVVSNFLSLIAIYVLTKLNVNSIILFAFVVMVIPVIVYAISTLYFFRKKYLFLSPSIYLFKKKYAKSILSLGINFFFIQISYIVLFQTSNILISNFFSPAEVTPYNIVFKYFSVPTMIWGIIMIPFWSAFTKAYTMRDGVWIKKVIKKLNIFFLGIILMVFILFFLSPTIIPFWTNDLVKVEQSYTFVFALHTILFGWNTMYAIFLNGVGKIKIQLILSVIAALLHLPISYLLIKHFNYGSEGVVISMAIVLIPFAIAAPIQTFYLIRKL